ncbi:MAG: hypothetical protein BWY37_01169 [Firmicutes bacterium ADurb.Bin262]|nr:MAG: hypothetical protein BWY37_01169 [Firmicutes bacterium ADurb.Bin262]
MSVGFATPLCVTEILALELDQLMVWYMALAGLMMTPRVTLAAVKAVPTGTLLMTKPFWLTPPTLMAAEVT